MITALKALSVPTIFLASSLNVFAADSAILNPEPVADWGGAYFGISLGSSNTEISSRGGNGETDEYVFGAHLGQALQLGNFVLGLEFEYRQDNTTIRRSAFGASANVDANFLLNGKIKAGIASGKNLFSVHGGGSYLSADANATFLGQTYSTVGGDVGLLVGASYDRMITEHLSVGVDYNFSRFENFDDANLDFDIQSINARATLRF